MALPVYAAVMHYFFLFAPSVINFKTIELWLYHCQGCAVLPEFPTIQGYVKETFVQKTLKV